MKKLEEQIRTIRLRQEAREKDLKDKEEETMQKEEEMKKARNTYKITDQQMRNRYEKYGIQHPDDMSACPVCQENIPDAEIEEGLSNKSLLRTHCCNQIIHKDCAVNHWSNVDYSRWQRCPACQNTPEWVRLINETEGRDPNSSVSNTRDFLRDRSRRRERERIERGLQVNFRIPAHEADESYQATTSYLGDVQRPIRHRLIDYENLPDTIDSYVYGIDNSITRRQWRDIHHILDEEGYIHDMNDGGRRIMELQGFETPFNRSINPNISERIFTDGEMIPVLVDGPGYAYHRDTLQLLGFFTPQGQLRIRTDIRPRININQLRRHQRNNLPIPLPTGETPAIQPQETENEFIIPAHNNSAYHIADGEFEEGPVRYRSIDYQSLREEDHPMNTPYNYNFSYIRERPRNVRLAIDSNGIIRNMYDNGTRVGMTVSYDPTFHELINRHIPPIFNDGETIPIYLDNHRYAYHRDTLQLIGFINQQGHLRIRSDIQAPNNRNEEMIEPTDEIEGRIVGRGGNVFTYPTQTLDTNNEQIRIEYNRVIDTTGNNSIYILRQSTLDERTGGRSQSNWEVEPRVWERINLNEIERYIPNNHDPNRPYGWNHMGIIQIYQLLALYSSYEPDRRYNDNAFRDTEDPQYNEMVREMLNDDFVYEFRFDFILTSRNNRAYSYDSRQYLGEIHNLERTQRQGHLSEDQISDYAEINRDTIRYLYNEIFLPQVNRDQPSVNEHPFRPYTDERNNNEIVGFENIMTSPMRHFRVGTRDVYSSMITGLGNVVFLTATMENNIVEAGIILADEITANNFQESWEEERDEVGVTTYGEWLDDHNEDMDQDEAVLIHMYNEMAGNPRFRERRLYIESSRLHLFDGETHRYLGSTYENDPSDILAYMYQNVYIQLYPVSRGGKRRKTLKKRKVIKKKSLKRRKVIKKKSLKKRKVIKKKSLRKKRVINKRKSKRKY